ncbi:unnamed protein product, partial [Rotaria magnacalcarata]
VKLVLVGRATWGVYFALQALLIDNREKIKSDDIVQNFFMHPGRAKARNIIIAMHSKQLRR